MSGQRELQRISAMICSIRVLGCTVAMYTLALCVPNRWSDGQCSTETVGQQGRAAAFVSSRSCCCRPMRESAQNECCRLRFTERQRSQTSYISLPLIAIHCRAPTLSLPARLSSLQPLVHTVAVFFDLLVHVTLRLARWACCCLTDSRTSTIPVCPPVLLLPLSLCLVVPLSLARCRRPSSASSLSAGLT